MLSINTNLPSLIAQSSLKTSTNKLNIAIERMTTGCKINSAKDNAANYSISTNMSTQIGALQIAEENTAMGLDLLYTVNDNLDLISNKLERLRILAEQAANGTYGKQSLKAINSEANSIIDEIGRIYSNAEYNNIKLFNDNEASSTPEPTTEISTVDEATEITEGTYTVSTNDDIWKLSRMSQSGKIKGGTFVMTNDISLSCSAGFTPNIDFSNGNIVFDGAGYTISNLRGERPLFNEIGSNSEVKNLSIKNSHIQTRANDSSLLAYIAAGKITNCSVDGIIEMNNYSAGGLVYMLTETGVIDNCHASVDITTKVVTNAHGCGGLVGTSSGTIKNSYTTGNISSFDTDTGGLVGYVGGGTIENCYADCIAINASSTTIQHTGGLVGYIMHATISDSYCNENARDIIGESYYTATINNCTKGIVSFDTYLDNLEQQNITIHPTNTTDVSFVEIETPLYINVQIGINNDDNSQIGFEIGFGLAGFSNLRNIGLNNTNYLSQIDSMISTVSTKQTEFGAYQNRLESALEEISIQYDNLVSSRSTLKDADVTEVSSEYIRQQILQQASSTLLATANQSPALALQLI